VDNSVTPLDSVRLRAHKDSNVMEVDNAKKPHARKAKLLLPSALNQHVLPLQSLLGKQVALLHQRHNNLGNQNLLNKRNHSDKVRPATLSRRHQISSTCSPNKINAIHLRSEKKKRKQVQYLRCDGACLQL
jgi:hypothetical protein